MKQDKNAGFTPKYLLEGEDITILPTELKQEKTQSDLKKDRKLTLHETIQSQSDRISRLEIWFSNNKLNRKKLDESKISPYKILQKISDSIYKIDTAHRKAESKMFHLTKLPPVPVAPTEEP
ncbi:Transposon Ty3-I Gag-Pol polyprotein [Vespula squamosa]|uniref:Transposon Ty3-I Gag-Pol polyprotein n=1 Tax=Vespula squamosa TaxID=30214 RepID=A0ABD2BJZ8_VESSQ